MNVLQRFRRVFANTTDTPPPVSVVRTSRDDDATASHILHETVHEVSTASAAASRTLRAKAAGLQAEAARARHSLFPEPEST
jgi:hypothetical protein